MKTIRAIAGPLMLMGTLSVLISVCGVVVSDRKYVKKDPAMQETVMSLASSAGAFGFATVLATLPICCFTGKRTSQEADT